MRALLQRVSSAKVEVDGKIVGKIAGGLLIFLGVRQGDQASDAEMLAKKISGLRIFEDEAGNMNKDLREAGGSLLVVSQFTLYADWRKGRRPAFTDAAPPEIARALYEQFCEILLQEGFIVERGIFAADMAVTLVNDGPVTLLLQSEP